MVDEADQKIVEVGNKSRSEGTTMVATTIPDPPQVGGVKAVPRAGEREPQQTVGNVAGRATQRVSARRSAPI